MSLPADDLLSAFHDGEVNSAERVAVEQRLAASAEGRRELSEVRQVSSLLRELPLERLPSEFPQQVLQAIERKRLTPAHRNEGRASPSLSARESWSKAGSTRRWVGAAAVLTSAAGLLLLVRAVDDRTGRATSEVRQLAGSPKLPAAPAEFSLDSSTSGGAIPTPMAADAPALRKNGIAGGTADSNSVAANSSLSTSPPFSGTASRDANIVFFDQSALRDAKIGDVVSAMQTEGTEVAVVWLTVVDRQEGLAGLQFLLANNRIARADTVEKADKGAKLNAPADQMHAVFVESDAEQLAATLKQLREKSFLKSLEVDQPIEMAQLDEVRAGRMLAAGKLGEALPANRTAGKEIAAKAPPEASSTMRRVTAPSLAAAEKRAADVASTPAAAPNPALASAKGAQESRDQLAKQVTLEFPLDALVQNQVSQQTRSRGMSRNQGHLQSLSEKNAVKAPADQRPMQVLFVVVDQVQASKQIPPANSPKPPAKARTKPTKPASQDGAA